MPTHIALLRGINVGGHKQLSMADVKATFESLGFENVRTLLNSGNVIFDGTKPDAKAIETAIGMDVRVILRTPRDLEKILEKKPFEGEPGKLAVMFLEGEPKGELEWEGPELVKLDGRNLYLYYPDGMGRSKLTNALIERRLKEAGTARNWNTITKLAHPKR